VIISSQSVELTNSSRRNNIDAFSDLCFFLLFSSHIIVRSATKKRDSIAPIQLVDYKLSGVTIELLHIERTITVEFSNTARLFFFFSRMLAAWRFIKVLLNYELTPSLLSLLSVVSMYTCVRSYVSSVRSFHIYLYTII